MDERFTGLLLDALSVGVIVIDQHGKIIMANQEMEHMFGYDRNELLGHKVETLVPQRFRAGHPNLRDGFFASPEKRVMGAGRDLRGVRKDGDEIPVDFGLSSLSANGENFAIATLVNISKRKRHEQRTSDKLERVDDELNQFAYVASHDLRAPLRGIENLCRWISQDTKDILPEKSKRHLEIMSQRIERMERLLNDLLRYSRANRVPVKVEETDLQELLPHIADLLSPPEGIVVHVSGGFPTIHVARSAIEQVFLNLIGNAIKHHDREDGKIEVSCKPKGMFFEFTVRDDGQGIPDKYHNRIFEMFQTLESRDRVEGSGMGLAIVKKIVEHHGGSIRIEPNDGRGTTMRFTWPKSMEEEA